MVMGTPSSENDASGMIHIISTAFRLFVLLAMLAYLATI